MLKLNQKVFRGREEFHVGGICGEIVFLVNWDGESQTYYTERELETLGYTWEEEKWDPKIGEKYWCVSDDGTVVKWTWENDSADKAFRDKSLLGIFPTKEAAEKALQEAKIKLGRV